MSDAARKRMDVGEGLEALLELSAVGVTLPLTEAYEDVELDGPG